MNGFRWILVAVAAVVLVATSAGIGVRATYGAQTTADEPQYLLTALSIWEDFSLDISDELEDRRYEDFHEAALPQQTRLMADGRRISPHDALLPLFLAVPVGLGGWVGAKLALAVLASVLAASMVWVAHRRMGVPVHVAGIVVTVLAASPPLAVYATQVYPEMAAALAVVAAIAALTSAPNTGRIVLLTSAVVALPWLAVKYVPLALVLAVGGVIWLPRRRRIQWVTLLAGLGSVYIGVHLWVYDGLTAYATGDHFVGGEFTAIGADANLWGRSARLVGLVVDRGFGLVPWQPAFLLAVVALGWWSIRGSHRMLLSSILVTGWLVATFVALTMHGWWFPGRQVVVVIPVLVLVLAQWSGDSYRRLGLLAAVGAVGIGAYVALVRDGLAGRLTWVVDFGTVSYLPHRLVTRILPDYMQPGAATWLMHGVWVVLLAGAATAGWLQARSAASVSPGFSPVKPTKPNNERQKA